MIASGLRAYLTAVDTTRLPASFAGRAFDAALLVDLPEGIDHCGEQGEFHTLAWDGPMFPQPLSVRLGERVVESNYAYCDVIPAGRDAGDQPDLPPSDAGQNEGPYPSTSDEHSTDPAALRTSAV